MYTSLNIKCQNANRDVKPLVEMLVNVDYITSAAKSFMKLGNYNL